MKKKTTDRAGNTVEVLSLRGASLIDLSTIWFYFILIKLMRYACGRVF